MKVADEHGRLDAVLFENLRRFRRKRPKTSRNVFGRLGLAIGIALGQLVLQVCIADRRTDGVVIRILVANDDGRCRHVLPLLSFRSRMLRSLTPADFIGWTFTDTLGYFTPRFAPLRNLDNGRVILKQLLGLTKLAEIHIYSVAIHFRNGSAAEGLVGNRIALGERSCGS